MNGLKAKLIIFSNPSPGTRTARSHPRHTCAPPSCPLSALALLGTACAAPRPCPWDALVPFPLRGVLFGVAGYRILRVPQIPRRRVCGDERSAKQADQVVGRAALDFSDVGGGGVTGRGRR
ncbi:uncharacterized protein SCHCODRAFT_02355800 [Schizophyllum commune H4-8]|uniref:uncharacterized protein n=1 Tax=Schizophyllum commune (strain H4-8 / FGSC 9210) TaxID=578458 RepID=UPI00215EE0FC|nr:uncharacterized protein SCHCODRAFT_02355800 [Schizophyllum commune H4-8]KAI5888939.1 hypothetical protein SCHCODRAFT_02355800 [Schizophyllum commune H4-8]